MLKSAIPVNEKFRVEALRSLNVLDTGSEKEFDALTSLANYICNTKVALISLTDSNRQWFKSKQGIDLCEVPRQNTLCSYAILQADRPLIIPDLTKDPRFKDDTFLIEDKPIVFYAGFPLVNQNGFALGTLCIIDTKPKELTNEQLISMFSLANQVVMLLELNKKNQDLQKAQDKLKKKNTDLKEFARLISHDLKMPLANIVTTSDLLQLKLRDALDEESKEYFGYIKESSFTMSNYINDILSHYESESLIHEKPEYFNLNDFLKEITELLGTTSDCKIKYPVNNSFVMTNKAVLKQIFFNLIGNSIKYNNKDRIDITIKMFEDEQFYYFNITDNGMGIPEDKLETIFDLFATASEMDRHGHKGNGIGLSTVKKLVEELGGKIKATSEINVFTTFDFSIKK